MLKTVTNPGGMLIEVFDGQRAVIVAEISQFFRDLSDAILRLQQTGCKDLRGSS